MRAAGEQLGISKSVVSYEIKKLEERLGARLFNRTTRKIVMTEAGSLYLQRAQALLSDWREVERNVAEYHSTPKGLLRIASPPVFGALYLAPALVDFQTKFADIKVELECGEQIVNIVESGFDLAVRVTVLSDTQLIRRRLAPNRLVLVASPGYLDAHGRPAQPLDLIQHRCLRHDDEWVYWSQWLAALPEHERPNLLTASMTLGSSFALRAAAVNGGGVALLHTYVVGDAVSEGLLEVLMLERTLTHGSICALFPHGRQMPLKTRVFLDFMAERFKGQPVWERDIFPSTRAPSSRMREIENA